MQRATGTHRLPTAMPPMPEWAIPKAQDTPEHPPRMAFAYKTVKAGQVHGTGGGDTFEFVPV